jgi:hypothetical protein
MRMRIQILDPDPGHIFKIYWLICSLFVMQHDKYTEVEILNRENLFETEIRLAYENVVQLNFCFI